MLATLPPTAQEFMDWDWSKIEPYFAELESRPLTAENVSGWLGDWTQIEQLIRESHERLYVTMTLDTADEAATQRYHAYLERVIEPFNAAAQKLKQKLLDSRLEAPGFDIPLRNMRQQAALFREANLPLLTEERKLATEYARIVGTRTVQWQGEEKTLQQLRPVFQSTDRSLREQAWRLSSDRQLADREAINTLWTQFMDVRRRIAANADVPDYRAYKWREMLRFDYTAEDCLRFHDAIEQVVVPAAARLYEKRRRQLGCDTLRPWDVDVDPLGRPPLRPFQTAETLEATGATIFRSVDPQLGDYFDTMRRENLLDLENRKGKAPGGYCIEFLVVRRPFIFMNAVGIHDDVQTLLHEGGHAFHTFESAHLPYIQQLEVPTEFAEVASMSMELLAGKYLPADKGGFYGGQEAARAFVEHLEGLIRFWPYMAVVDAFQHWVYTHHDAASDPANCDAKWLELWNRFMQGVDFSGLEADAMTGWHRKLHIHEVPFYYVEYGLAQLGAVQVWRNSLRDAAGAVANYRRGLALGGTAALPQLFAAAGAQFRLDAAILRDCVDLIEQTIAELETTS